MMSKSCESRLKWSPGLVRAASGASRAASSTPVGSRNGHGEHRASDISGIFAEKFQSVIRPLQLRLTNPAPQHRRASAVASGLGAVRQPKYKLRQPVGHSQQRKSHLTRVLRIRVRVSVYISVLLTNREFALNNKCRAV